MAVLVEAISLIIRRDAIDLKYSGGWEAFTQAVPNATLCSDDEIARVGFMHPDDVRDFMAHLELHGLRYMTEDRARDFAVVDQQRGCMQQCDWLEFGRLSTGDGARVSACWFFDEPRHGFGVHVHGLSVQLATPTGWKFEGSLSQEFHFVPDDQKNQRLEFLRREGSTDVYLNLDTGKEVYLGRSAPSTDSGKTLESDRTVDDEDRSRDKT